MLCENGQKMLCNSVLRLIFLNIFRLLSFAGVMVANKNDSGCTENVCEVTVVDYFT